MKSDLLFPFQQNCHCRNYFGTFDTEFYVIDLTFSFGEYFNQLQSHVASEKFMISLKEAQWQHRAVSLT